MENEAWLPVPDAPGYLVSSLGRIKSLPRSRTPGGILSASKSSTYPQVFIAYKGIRRSRNIHRLMALAFFDIKPDQVVNHKDGNKHNNLLTNLEVCTRSYNQLHSAHVLGHAPPNKTPDKIARYILKNHVKLGGQQSTEELAEKFSLSISTVSLMVRAILNKNPDTKIHMNRKLTDKQISYIVRLRETNSSESIAKMFKVCRATIDRIIARFKEESK